MICREHECGSLMLRADPQAEGNSTEPTGLTDQVHRLSDAAACGAPRFLVRLLSLSSWHFVIFL